MSPLDWIAGDLGALEQKGLRRRRREVKPLPGGRCEIGGRTLWNFSANDYLGLSGDNRLQAAAIRAMSDGGLGARASPLVSGRTLWHVELEQALASLKQTESALLFPSGYAANLGTIPALVGSEDVLFCDRLNHASLIDGCRLSAAKFRVYPHVDVEALRKELSRSQVYRRRLIVTDSLFSMDGDHAPLKELASLAEEFDAMLLVDEAHATGVYGACGGGLLEEAGIHFSGLIAMGTLSKGVGAQGGFIAGTRELVDWLSNSARTQIYSTALPIPVCAAAREGLNIICEEPERRRRLLKSAEELQQSLRAQGWHIPDNVRGPILPIIVGDAERAVSLAGKLEEKGILVAAIRPPTVPRGTARLRLSLSAAHSEEGLQRLLVSMNDLRSES